MEGGGGDHSDITHACAIGQAWMFSQHVENMLSPFCLQETENLEWQSYSLVWHRNKKQNWQFQV